MGDPKLEEFCRAHDFKPSFLRDMQRYIRDEVQPKLDERERLLAERTNLAKLPTVRVEGEQLKPLRKSAVQEPTEAA